MAFDLGSAYGSIQIDVADAMAGLDKLGIAMAAASAVAVAAIAKMTDSASNLAEEISKSSVIWGEQAAEIESFADRAAQALGISKQSALEATSTFSVYATQMGLSGTEAAGFSTQMTQLAADMASFSNTSPEEAIQALGSAFRGESDPIERYGVQLVGVTDGLEGNAKAMAIYQSILAQTGNAQGDFERTSGGLAAQQKILSAEFANVQTEIGAIFLPIALELTRALMGVVEVIKEAVARFNELSPPIKNAILAVGGIVLAIGPALVAMTGIVAAVGMVTAALASPLIVPIGAAIAAVTALAAAFIFFGDDIVAVANSVLSYGVGIAQQLAAGIMAGVSYVVDALSYIGEVITSWLIPNSPPKLLPDIDTWGTQTAAGGGAAPKIGGGGRGGAAPKMGGGAMPAFELPKIDPAFGQSLQAAGDAVVGVQTKMTAAKTAFDGFATTTGSVVTKIKEFATALLAQVTPEITKLQTGAVALGASIAQQLTPAVASIKEGLGAFATGAIALGGAIGEKLSPTVTAAKDAIVLFGSLLSTGLQSVATITTTVITDTITPLWNGLVTTIGAWGVAFGGVLTVAGAAMSALAALIIGDKDRIGTAFSDLKTAVTTTMGQLWTALQTSVTAFGTIFLTVVKSLTTSILGEFGYTKEQAEIKWGEIYLVIMNALTQAVEMVTGLGEDIKTALVTSIQAAIDGVTGLVSGMSSIGADMVAGIASGITGAAGQIGSAMTGAVGGAVDSVRRFLDSNSPSRYTAAVVGLPMTQGVAGGVEEGEPMVVAAMRQAVAAAISKVKKLTQESGESVNVGIGGTLRPNLPPSGGSVAPIRPILQGGGAGDTINVRIDSFTSNKREDVERLAESIADIIAKRKRK